MGAGARRFAVLECGRRRTARRSARRTVARIILLNLVFQVVVAGIVAGAHMSVSDSLVVSLATALVFYGGIAAWVGFRSMELGLQARLLIGRRVDAIGEGLALGGGAAMVVMVVLRLTAGHNVVDPTASALADQSAAVLLLGVFVIAAIAPIVEEIVFRGFLAEALKARGTAGAVLVSSLSFALAHLRLVQLPYYTALGAGLAFLYWRRGLIGSIAAHAAFNGTLVLVAVIAIHGPAVMYHVDGMEVRLPAAGIRRRCRGRTSC